MKKYTVTILFTFVVLATMAINPPTNNPGFEAGKPDTIIVEIDDSTTVMIISETESEFSSLTNLSFDTLISALSEVMESTHFQNDRERLEFEIAEQEFEKAMQAHEMAMRIHEKHILEHEKNMAVHEQNIREQEKMFEELENMEDVEELERLKDLEELERLNDLKSIEVKEEENKDQIMITVSPGLGLVRDKISPSADFILAFAIKKYYYSAIANMNFTFEKRDDNSYRTLNNLFVGLEFGHRYNKKDTNKRLVGQINNLGLSYLVRRQENYFGDNTFKLYFGANAGPVVLQPQLIVTDNFEQWYPSLGIRFRL